MQAFTGTSVDSWRHTTAHIPRAGSLSSGGYTAGLSLVTLFAAGIVVGKPTA